MSINVTVLAHNASTEKMVGYTKIGQVIIGDNVFIGAGATILPNVIIGNNSIIAAGSVVAKSVPENVIVAGNPAKIISDIYSYKIKHQDGMKETKCFGKEYTMRHRVSDLMKKEMIEQTTKKIAYIR